MSTNPLDHWHVESGVMHNYEHVNIMASDESIWPLTCGRWHGAQFCTWCFHAWPSQPSKNKTLEGKTFSTHRMTQSVITSNVVSVFLLQINIIFKFKPWTLGRYPHPQMVAYCNVFQYCETKFSISICMVLLKKATFCSQTWMHTLRSSRLITLATSLQTYANNCGSCLKNTKWRKMEARDVCLLNQYPLANHGNYIITTNGNLGQYTFHPSYLTFQLSLVHLGCPWLI